MLDVSRAARVLCFLAPLFTACSSGWELPPAQQKGGGGTSTPATGSGASGSSSAAASSGGYLGCFVDQGDPHGTTGRDLDGATYGAASMTIESCAADCAGFAYYGIEDGTQCFCGSVLSAANAANCNMACAGNASENCGGYWALAAYKH